MMKAKNKSLERRGKSSNVCWEVREGAPPRCGFTMSGVSLRKAMGNP